MLDIQSFGANGCRYHCFRRCHGFVNLQAGSAPDPQWNNYYRGLLQIFDDGGYPPRYFDRQ